MQLSGKRGNSCSPTSTKNKRNEANKTKATGVSYLTYAEAIRRIDLNLNMSPREHEEMQQLKQNLKAVDKECMKVKTFNCPLPINTESEYCETENNDKSKGSTMYNISNQRRIKNI